MPFCRLHREFAYWLVVVGDKVSVDDDVFFEKLVEAVRVLFVTHAALDIGGDSTKERLVLCICDCNRFALYPSEQNRARLMRSWGDLGVYERRALRKVVHLEETARNIAFLELTGMRVRQAWPSVVPVDLSTLRPVQLGRKRLVSL